MIELAILGVLGVCAVISTIAMIYFGHKVSVFEDPTPVNEVPTSGWYVYDSDGLRYADEGHPPCPVSGAAATRYVDEWYRAAHELRHIHRKSMSKADQLHAEKAMGDLVRSLRAFVPADYLSTTAAILNAEHRRKTEAPK